MMSFFLSQQIAEGLHISCDFVSNSVNCFPSGDICITLLDASPTTYILPFLSTAIPRGRCNFSVRNSYITFP